VVIHHTNCELCKTTNEALQARVAEATGRDVSHIDFLPFTDMEASVREDMAALRNSSLLPEEYEVVGFVYDVASGKLSPVDDAS